MGVYVKRVQTLLTEEEYQDLSRLSADWQKPLSALIREAVEKVYFEQVVRERRRAALGSLLALRAPVADWPEMEQEIIQGATEK
jgi:hypothetical protein